jgi:hypothetical protein
MFLNGDGWNYTTKPTKDDPLKKLRRSRAQMQRALIEHGKSLLGKKGADPHWLLTAT